MKLYLASAEECTLTGSSLCNTPKHEIFSLWNKIDTLLRLGIWWVLYQDVDTFSFYTVWLW